MHAELRVRHLEEDEKWCTLLLGLAWGRESQQQRKRDSGSHCFGRCHHVSEAQARTDLQNAEIARSALKVTLLASK
jgi:hypothetical protein